MCSSVRPEAHAPSEAREASEDEAPRRRPADATDALVGACGKASEALEYLIRVRGHVYSMHQLTGRADFLLEEAADLFDRAGCPEAADELRRDIVGRNVLDGRWTFQVVEEFDDLYYGPVERTVRDLERQHMAGHRHVYEAELKEARRSAGRSGHEARPPAAHDPGVEV